MDTQLTPIHTRLWHREFWMLSFAGMLLTVSAFMQLPVLGAAHFIEGRPAWMGWGYAAFGGGLLFFGCLISFLVEKYRRNAVCIWAILLYMAFFVVVYELPKLMPEVLMTAFLTLRFMEGAAYGLAQMVLVSTLVTDCCESAQRTDANYAMAWFQRLAIAIGPAAGIVVVKFYDGEYPLLAVCASAFLAILLILFVDFPFRAPEDNSFHLSLDRFFLPEGIRISCHVFALGFVLGLLLVCNFSLSFFALLIVGFLLALGGEMMMTQNGWDDWEPVMGIVLLIVALLFQFVEIPLLTIYVVPPLVGLGIGLAMPRLQIFFIHISAHCQRGTSQSSFWIVWELGMALGMALTFAFFADGLQSSSLDGYCFGVALVVTVISLLSFVFLTRMWYRSHIRR